jgi:hypothetical protein
MGARGLYWISLGLIIGMATGGMFLHSVPSPAREEEREAPGAGFEERTGLRIVRVAVTAGGGMIDLRYQVIDPEKARAFCTIRNGAISLKEPPMILLEGTGEILKTPWMSHSHVKTLRAGVVYYVLLLNIGGKVQRGQRVTVIIGGVPAEHVLVQ